MLWLFSWLATLGVSHGLVLRPVCYSIPATDSRLGCMALYFCVLRLDGSKINGAAMLNGLVTGLLLHRLCLSSNSP